MTSEASGDETVGSFGKSDMPHCRRQRYEPEIEEGGESLLSPRLRRQ